MLLETTNKSVKCPDCGKEYEFPVPIGNKYEYEFRFYCISCGTEIKVDINQSSTA